MKTFGIAIFLILILASSTCVIDANADHLKSKTSKDLRDIKPTDTTKTVKITKITKSRTLHVWNIVGVQVCAGTEKLYSPDLEIRSDQDTIKVTVWGLIMPKNCKTSEFFIRANDPDSITVIFLDLTPISQIRNEKI